MIGEVFNLNIIGDKAFLSDSSKFLAFEQVGLSNIFSNVPSPISIEFKVLRYSAENK